MSFPIQEFLDLVHKHLEKSVDSTHRFLGAWTLLVAIGLILEYAPGVAKLIGKKKLEEHPYWWMRLYAFIGPILVTVGVAGELLVGGQFGLSEGRLRSVEDSTNAQLRKTAAEATERAANAEVQVTGAKGIAESARATAKGFESRITEAKKESARLYKIAEDERLARVNLEKQIAPRSLDESDREAIGKQLRQFAATFAGRKIEVSSYSADAEGIVFSVQIIDILAHAGIGVDPVIGRTVPIGLVHLGVKITGPSADGIFIKTLIDRVQASIDTAFNGEWGAKYKDVKIEVGVKPIAGLTEVKLVTPPPK